MRLTKKLLPAFLALVMVFSMLPLQVFAEQVTDGTKIPVQQGSRPGGAAAESQSERTIQVGETITVQSKKDDWGSYEWSSSDSSIASVTKKRSGDEEITGKTPGSVTIQEKKNTILGSYVIQTIRVEVVSNVEGITIPEALTLTGKTPGTLTATVEPENAQGYTIAWSVADDGVATVDGQGKVTPVAVGTTTVTATISGTNLQDTCTVTVEEPKEFTVTLEKLTLMQGQEGTMPVEITPEPLAPKIFWSINDLEVATIDPETGLIHAVSQGVATVTAVVAIGTVTREVTAQLTVVDGQLPTSISLNREKVTLQGLGEVQLNATVWPWNLPEAAKVVSWESTNPSVATVYDNGLVKAVAPGEATILAKTINGLQDTCDITVETIHDGQNTEVYVYLQITADDGVSTDGWHLNETGEWYTIGKIVVPHDVLPPADRGQETSAQVLMPYLPYIELHNINKDVAAGVTLQNCSWELKRVSTGANNYKPAGWTWHLDGYLHLENVKHTLTVKYQDTYGNTLKSPKISQYRAGSSVEVEIPQILGYTPVRVDNQAIAPNEDAISIKITGDKTMVIKYRGGSTSYTQRYVEKGTSRPIAEDTSHDATLGQTVEAKNIGAPQIPNFTFAKQITPNSLTVGGNPGANVFTLYYTRNQHTVTYKYTHPITGQEVIVDSKTQGAGLAVEAKADPNIPGYKFTGWEDTAERDKVKIENGKFIMPDRDVTFTGSFSVPDSQKYAVKVNVYLGNGNKAQQLETKTKEEITWDQLTSYYSMNHYEVANAIWGRKIFDSNNDLLTHQWKTKQDASLTFPDKYHELNLYLKDEEGGAFVFTLTYDANAGTDTVTDMPNPQSAKYLKGTEVTVAPAPTRENYTFTVWNTAANGSGTSYSANETITLTEDTTLFAQWTANTAEYKVQYLFEQLDGQYTQKTGIPEKTESGNIGTELTRDALKLNSVPKGYSLNDVKTASTFTITDDAGKNVFQIFYKLNRNSVTYQLDKNYTFTHPAVPDAKMDIPYGQEVTVNTKNMNEGVVGYTFTGWNTEDATVNGNKFSMPDKPVVFTGSYTINSHKVTYELTAEDGSYTGEMPGPTDYEYDALVYVWTPKVADGYEFSGWTVEGAVVENGVFSMPDNAVILRGTISRRKYTVSYAYGTGSAEPEGYELPGNSALHPFGSVVKLADPNAQTAEGYTFDGWFTDADCSENSRVTGDYEMPIGGGTLYGKFKANEYTVTCHLDAPTGVTVEAPKPAQHAYKSEVTVADIVVPAGYSFVGWHTRDDSKVVVKDGDESFKMPAGDVELYGEIKANDNTAYTVVYKFQNADNDGYSAREDVDFKTLYGTTGGTTAAPQLADGDVPNGFKYKETKNVTITGDGKAVAEVYYDRLTYTISWTVDGTNGDAVDKKETLRFEEPIGDKGIYPADPTPNAGYKFAGWQIQNPGMTALPEKMPAEDILITGSYTAIDYKVTYKLAEGSETPENYTAPVDTNKYHIGSTVTVKADERVPGYDFEGWYTENGEVTEAMSTFTMPADNVTMYGKFTFATDTKYTVEHYFENLGGGYPAEPNYTESKVGTTSQLTEAMPIPAGSITGFTVDGSWKQQTIKPDGSTVVKIYYTRNSYNLTIHYRNVGGAAVADSYHGTYKFGETWKVVSPIVAGYYDPQIRSISSGANGMPAQDLKFVVTYTAIPVPAPDPGPAPNPGPDDGDDDDDTPPAPVEPEEPSDYEVDPDDYTLTEVEDNETPLANLNLEGHTCCILHLLLMLAAMVVLGFDTKSRKKHQARIFELKKMLAMEEDHSDDPEQP